MGKIIWIFFIFLFFGFGIWYVKMTNPYSKWTLVKPFYRETLDKNGQFKIYQIHKVFFIKNPLIDLITYFQRGFRILNNVYFPEKPFKGHENKIIYQIHKERFDVSKPYVISGANFPELYVRNFGLFYSAILDPRFGFSQNDWENREKVTLQAVVLHLNLLRLAGREYTTFIPMWKNTFTAVNWNAEPSDSLFALFYTLNALKDKDFIIRNFPSLEKPKYKLQTENATNILINSYRNILIESTNNYLSEIIDSKTGIIKKDILLSSARDGIKRQSSFYDNVIAWSTVKLGIELGLNINCPNLYIISEIGSETTIKNCNFNKWKKNIINTFWDEKAGIFLDDLSSSSIKNHVYSGDAFIVTSTKFLNFKNSEDRRKIEKEIFYIQKNNLDKPFPLRYAVSNHLGKLYFFIKYFAPSYMGESIWSHWGMEYIKTLILLSKYNPAYLIQAKNELSSYRNNILKYGGYPELYNKNGSIFKTFFYKSLLQTGWVVNYEEAQMMLGEEK